ncbi:MAG: zinc ribbon domain-containing protein [Anaerolineae bacterium]|nr:zinc ribbon domain-containing protein [Anaerolineae bacterium]
MTELIEFTSNYRDLSTDRGFQWEFYCERCSGGYRSKFDASETGLLSEAMNMAGGFFGGLVGNIAQATDRVHSVAWERGHDQAFTRAVEEVRDYFIQCPNCNAWVCRKRCWNENRGLCFECAPDASVAAAQSQAETIAQQAREEVAQRKYNVSQFTKGDDRRAGCPNCGASLKPNAKFCGECGTAIKTQKFCVECGAELEGTVKFCPECGAKQ